MSTDSSTRTASAPAPRLRLPRWAARAPILLYRLGLGFLLGHRFLLLEHRGRRSGQVRRTVLEIIQLGDDVAVVMSGFGHRSDWLRNVAADPEVGVTIGRTRRRATARIADESEAVRRLAQFRSEHRHAFGEVCKLWSLDPAATTTPAELFERAPVVVFALGATLGEGDGASRTGH